MLPSEPRSNNILSIPDGILTSFILPLLSQQSQIALLSTSRQFHSLLYNLSPMLSISDPTRRKGATTSSTPTVVFRVGVFNALDHDNNTLFASLNRREGSPITPQSLASTSTSVLLSPEHDAHVRLCFEQINFAISSPKDSSRYRGLHCAVVVYDTADVYSLLESAKCILSELDRFAVPVSTFPNSPNLMTTQVLLVGTRSRMPPSVPDGASLPEKPAADVERASTLAPICRRVNFVSCVELDPSSETTVERMERFLAQVCYTASLASNLRKIGKADKKPPRCVIM